MTLIESKLKGAWIIKPKTFADDRGSFCEKWNSGDFIEKMGVATRFVQMNQSVSKKNVLRGLHYQYIYPQAKLVWVSSGSVLDVFVDLRKNSPTFGQWDSYELTGNDLIYIPEDFAHGFVVTSEEATFSYLVSDFRFPQYERTLMWNDPDLNINWGVTDPILSEKDKQGHLLKDFK
jgi:dTDP-4-dehydrorhamnose 3,5-epimerase